MRELCKRVKNNNKDYFIQKTCKILNNLHIIKILDNFRFFSKILLRLVHKNELLFIICSQMTSIFFSNDPWGPTTALMSEIADLTHNPMSFTEIMSMIWKRLNDHGKNWRHVYKSLVLLDYLVKCGSEKVATQCRENIYSIETLRDFQHIEENRDQGLNVREKAKQMVSLLYDEERLKNERARFLLTRKRFAQNGSGIASDGTTRSTRRHDASVIGK